MIDAPDPREEAELGAVLEAMAALPEEARFIEELAGSLFPGGGELRQLTWPERAPDASSEPGEAGHLQRTEERLRAAEARFRTLIEQIPAVTFMAVLGEGKNEVYVSPHIEAMLGYTQQEWLEDPFLWYRQLHPDDRPRWNEEFARGCRTGGPFRAECRFLARDGHVVWVHGEARLVRDGIGRPQFLQGVAFDITESKRAQEILLTEAVRSARIEEELDIARRMQTSILPRRFDVPGLEIAAVMRAADAVGGDYYDVMPCPGGCWIAIGDVTGHGVNAGLVMLMVQSALSAIVRGAPHASPRDVLAQVNEVLFDNIRNRLERDDHVTLSLLRYGEDGLFVMTGAHEDVLVLRGATGLVESVRTQGTWVGARTGIASANFDRPLRLDPGDTMLLFTDGITEARSADGELFDLARLEAALAAAAGRSPSEIRDEVLGAVDRFMVRQQDDVTLLVIRYGGPPERGARRPGPADTISSS